MSKVSSGEIEGMPMAWLKTPMTPMAVPSANNAETMGNNAAKIEPNTSSSTISASSTPRPVLLKDWLLAFSASGPVSDTVNPSPEVPVTMAMYCLASALLRLLVCLSKLTGIQPTVRASLMFVVLTRFPALS